MSKWRDRVSAYTPHFVEHEVRGLGKIKFYPVDLHMVFRLRQVGKPLAGAISDLFVDRNNDYTSIERQVMHENGDGLDREIIAEAVSVEIAKFRAEQREKAVEELIECLTDKDSSAVIAELLMNSMRDEFPKGDPDNPPAAGFFAEINSSQIADLLTGFAKAHKEVFGPLGGMMEGAIRDRADILAKINPEAEGDSTPTSSG
jgi:hypothetical protein